MERRQYLALATSALLAGCQAIDDPGSTPTETATATEQPTATGSPTPTETESGTETRTETETETETETPTERPDPRAAEELDEARVRLNRAVGRYARESHRPGPESILDATADSEGFTPGRVTGSIDDARLSLGRAEERASADQRATVEALRAFADWLERAVGVQRLVVAAAGDCRAALEGDVPSDGSDVRAAFVDLAETAGAARTEVDSLSTPEADVGDQLEALEAGDVAAKTEQLEREVDALEELASYGESIVEGIDLLDEASATNFAEAEELAEEAVDEFAGVESGAATVEVPESLSEEQRGLVEQAADWTEHAEDEAEDYRDARND